MWRIQFISDFMRNKIEMELSVYKIVMRQNGCFIMYTVPWSLQLHLYHILNQVVCIMHSTCRIIYILYLTYLSYPFYSKNRKKLLKKCLIVLVITSFYFFLKIIMSIFVLQYINIFTSLMDFKICWIKRIFIAILESKLTPNLFCC